MRLGFRSSASIDVDTSIASMMSIPSTVLFFHEFCVCGRASANTSSTKTATRNHSCSGISATFHERVTSRYTDVSLMRIVGSVFLLYSRYHTK